MFILYSSKEQNWQKHVVLKNQWGSKEIDKYLLGGSIDLIESSQKNFGAWGPPPLVIPGPPNSLILGLLGVLLYPGGDIPIAQKFFGNSLSSQ